MVAGECVPNPMAEVFLPTPDAAKDWSLLWVRKKVINGGLHAVVYPEPGGFRFISRELDGQALRDRLIEKVYACARQDGERGPCDS